MENPNNSGESAVSAVQTKSFIYQLIYEDNMQTLPKIKNSRSPTLDTVRMVEAAAEKRSGTYNRRELWKKLPKKVMWQTFLVVIAYLEDAGKIGIDREGKIAYVWNPELVRKLMARPELSRRNLNQQ